MGAAYHSSGPSAGTVRRKDRTAKRERRANCYEVNPKNAGRQETLPVWSVLTGGLFLVGGAASAAQSFSPLLDSFLILAGAVLLELLAIGIGAALARRKTAGSARVMCRLLPLLPILAAALCGGAGLWRGFAAWLNLLTQGINESFGTELAARSTDCSLQQAAAAAAVMAMAQVCISLHLVRRRRLPAAFLYSLAWTVLLLVQGQFSPQCAVFFMLGILGLLMNGRHRNVPGTGVLFWCAAAAALEAGAVLCGEGELLQTRLLRENTGEYIHYLRYGQKELPEGTLADAGLLGTSTSGADAAAILVYTDQEKTLYLKGYTGAVYHNGQWTPLDNSAYSGDNAGMLSWLHRQGFDPQTQAASYWALGDESLLPPRSDISVTVVNASREQFYLPYTLVSPVRNGKRDKDLGIRSGGFLGNPMYRFAALNASDPCELMTAQGWVLQPENEEQERYLTLEAVYRQFVYENYTQVDASLQDLLESYFWTDYPAEGDGIYRAVERVREVLSARITYTAQKEEQPLPGEAGTADGTDALTLFLTQSRKGNAAWFATAAAMALRAHGIPARYAEGYYAAPGDFEQKETAFAELSAENEHAWVEVYLDGVGWLPVDVTPGYYLSTVQLEQLAVSPDSVHKTAKLEDSDFKAEDSQQGSSAPEEQSLSLRNLTANPLRLLAGILALLLILATALLAAREAYRGTREVLLERRYRRAGSRERAFLNEKRLQELLALCGLESALGWGTEETDRLLAERFSSIRPGEYRQVCRSLEKTLYGGIAMEIYEERMILAFLDKLQEINRSSRRNRLRGILRGPSRRKSGAER